MKSPKLWGLAALTFCWATSAVAGGFVEYCEKKDKSKDAAYTIELLEGFSEVEGCAQLGEFMKQVDVLGLDSPDLVDVTALTFFDNIEEMSLRSDKALKVAPLAKMTKLKGLLVDAPIPEITALPINLTTLHVFRTKSLNIAPDAVFKNLEDFAIYDSGVASFEFLKSSPKLEVLAAVNAGITSLDQLPEHKGLKVLELRFNKLSSLAEITKFPSLINLEIAGNAVADIQPLAALPEMEVLGLSNNPIKDLALLKDSFAKLEVLHLDGLKLTQLPDLGAKPNLSALSAAGNQITDISALSAYTKLVEIVVSDNQIKDVEALSKLPALERLYAKGNAIKGIAKVPAALRLLYLEKNGITNLDWLKGQDLPELSYIDFSHNSVEDLTPLSHLAGIFGLAFNSNTVRTLAGLDALEFLEDVEANSNQIEDITAIAEHPTLAAILLNDNQIKDVSVLGNNGVISEIELKANPLGTTIAKTDENCPPNRGPAALQFWCRLRAQ